VASGEISGDKRFNGKSTKEKSKTVRRKKVLKMVECGMHLEKKIFFVYNYIIIYAWRLP
jgi:hypothetical protein